MFNTQVFKFWITALAATLGLAYFFLSGGTWLFFFASWFISTIITKISNVAYHRWIAHNMFKPNMFGQIFLLWTCVASCLTPPVRYAIGHRLHHMHPDTEHDPHNPKLGFFKCLMGSFNSSFKGAVPVKDVLRKKLVMFVDKHYYPLYFLNLLILALISPQFAVLSFSLLNLRAWVNITLFNYIAHGGKSASGARNLPTWTCYLLGHLGEQLHENHHAHPAVVNFGTKTTFNRDVLYFFIKPFLK
jgi:fatty-acid desaturase